MLLDYSADAIDITFKVYLDYTVQGTYALPPKSTGTYIIKTIPPPCQSSNMSPSSLTSPSFSQTFDAVIGTGTATRLTFNQYTNTDGTCPMSYKASSSSSTFI
jgi:hypothetical protein